MKEQKISGNDILLIIEKCIDDDLAFNDFILLIQDEHYL